MHCPASAVNHANPAPLTLAATADRHRLYELAVQCPEAEVDFVDRNYRRLRNKSARSLREDFCGTAAVSCEWVRRRKINRAIGVDLDPEVLEWGRINNLERLTEHQERRTRLFQEDVMRIETRPLDLVLAMNFSYWLLRERQVMLHYFRRVHTALKDDGVFFLDAYGGYDSFRVITEERVIDDGQGGRFTYFWEQEYFDPITARLICHIHFRLADGSELNRAFSYDWRLWTLPEIRELLEEAGFTRFTVYWQGWDQNGDPDGIFVPVEHGEPDAGWICYLSAEK